MSLDLLLSLYGTLSLSLIHSVHVPYLATGNKRFLNFSVYNLYTPCKSVFFLRTSGTINKANATIFPNFIFHKV